MKSIKEMMSKTIGEISMAYQTREQLSMQIPFFKTFSRYENCENFEKAFIEIERETK
jgi:hypothetical protein